MSEERYEPKRSVPSLFWPLLLITAGVLFLLQNLGYLPFGFWATVWRFWPVILILIGIQLFFGHRYPWLAAGLMVALLVATIGAAALLSGSVSGVPVLGRAVGETGERVIAEELGDLERARLNLTLGAGRVRLESLPEDSNLLVETYIPGLGARSEINYRLERRNGEGILRVESRRSWTPFDSTTGEWDIRLSPRIPIRMEIQLGAGEYDLDLTDLQVPNLTSHTGAGRTIIRLPAEAGRSQTSVQAGVGELIVIVPQDVDARIRIETGIGATNVDESRFPRSGDEYVSPGFDQSDNRVDLRIQAGVGSVTVR